VPERTKSRKREIAPRLQADSSQRPGIAVALAGVGHAVGSEVVSNSELALSLGLESDWFLTRTGIVERRACGPGEDVLTLGRDAVLGACEDAGLRAGDLGAETMLLHIQNGIAAFTPPAAILLSRKLGFKTVRALGFDGVCAEPIAALEVAALLLEARRCDRVILSAAVDFPEWVDPNDHDTSGLFGSGAGAIVLERSVGPDARASLRGVHWETHAGYSGLGQIPVLGYERHPERFSISVGYYEMDGRGLTRAALQVLPGVLEGVLDAAGWTREDADLVLAHQPNAKLLEIGMRHLGLDPARVPMPVRHLGNMGPASLLVNLSLAKTDGRLAPGTNLLLIAFGLGFSCGAAALTL